MKSNFLKIKKLELELLDPSVRKNKKRLSELLADDFLEFASVGIIFNKKDILKILPKQDLSEWKASSLRFRELSNGVILLTYKAKKINQKSGDTVMSLRSSIWKNIKNNWQMVFHQGTLLK